MAGPEMFSKLTVIDSNSSLASDVRITDLRHLYETNVEHVRKYTQHLVIYANLDIVLDKGKMTEINKLIEECDQLQSICWRVAPHVEGSENEYRNIPNHYNYVRYKDLPLRLLVALPTFINNPSIDLQFEALSDRLTSKLIPAELAPTTLISLRCIVPERKLNGWNETRLAAYIVKATNLESLSVLVSRDSFTSSQQWLFPIPTDATTNGRFPPLKELRLIGYDWPQSPEHFSRLWDFSRLTSLELRYVHVDNFFLHVPFEMLSRLLELSFTHRRDAPSIRPEGFVFPDVKNGLWSHLVQLRKLEIGCWWEKYLDLKTLTMFPRLKKLNLALFGPNSAQLDRQSCLTLGNLEFVLKTCPELEFLGLAMDIDASLDEAKAYLTTICEFKTLTTLRLDTNSSSPNPDFQNAFLLPSTPAYERDVNGHGIIKHLVYHKQGQPFTKISIVLRGKFAKTPWYNPDADTGESLRFEHFTVTQLVGENYGLAMMRGDPARG